MCTRWKSFALLSAVPQRRYEDALFSADIYCTEFPSLLFVPCSTVVLVLCIYLTSPTKQSYICILHAL